MKLTLNLASRSYLNRRALFTFYGVACLVLILLLVLGSVEALRGQERLRTVEERLGQMREEIAALKGPATGGYSAEAARRQGEELAFANEIILRDAYRWTELLDRLERVVPEGVSVRGIQPDYKSGNLKLSCSARSVRKLRNFLDRLIDSTHFSEHYLLRQSRAKVGGGKTLVHFSVVVKGVF